MKVITILILCLVLPIVASADGLATIVCVLDNLKFNKLVNSSGDIAKVDSRDIRSASLKTGFLSKAPDRFIRLEFKKEGRQLSLHVTQQDDMTIYAILDITKGITERLIVAGQIATGREVAESINGEPLIVVLRTGNFLKQ